MTYARLSPFVRVALVSGGTGVCRRSGWRAVSVMAFTVRDGRIAAIDSLSDADRLRRLDLPALGG